MPLLDVSSVLLDPDFATRFTVRRRTQVISAKGRTTTTDTDTPNVVGVITVASPTDLERLPDDQRMGRNMLVVTKYRLRGPSKDNVDQFQPDLVLWTGDTFIVKDVQPYTEYGAGFMQCIIGSIDLIDKAST